MTNQTAASSPDTSTDAPLSPGVAGTPRIILRLEGAALLALTTFLYAQLGALGWGIYAALFFWPDLAFFGFLAGPRVGAAVYNTTHSTLGPVLLGVAGTLLATPLATAVALVWAAHVGFDRMLGYGLKYRTAFGHTHLGRVGKAA